jgi:hypothetical protein
MSDFIYLLNAMEAAAQADNPAQEGYGAKRKAVLDYVAEAEAEILHMKGLTQAQPTEAARSEWITVADRVPPFMHPVIASDGVQVKACYRTGDTAWSAFSSLQAVTHWMPYPAAPRMNNFSEGKK